MEEGVAGTPVCVLGFGRSGTSLTTRLLNLLGVDVGPEEDLLGAAGGDNPRGYWEPRWMIELNDEILARLDTVWQQPFPAAPGWETEPELDDLRERARELLLEKFGASRLWGFKDPRVMLTLPFWQQVMPAARYVICLRNPADVISSFQRRPEPNLPLEEWGDLWMEYNARALRETRERPRMLVFYEDLFRDGANEIARMASFLGLPAPPEGDPARRALLDEIDPELRHHSTSPTELAGMWGISPAARALFLAVRAGENVRRFKAVAGLRGDGVADAIEQLMPDLWFERRLLTAARVEREQLAGELDGERRERAELERTRQRLDSELADARAALAQADAGGARLQEELTQAQAELGSSAAHRREVDAELAALQATLAHERALIDGLQSSVSWRITTPLRAVKRVFIGGRAARTKSASPVQR
ncbi:MAG TPA: sulfotransferase [Solirubrobacteraceae bacterium]|nr:sulfotransferase [Solirubrobacteraceae bacterium]